MQKLSYVIIDDEKACVRELQALLNFNMPGFEMIGSANTPEEAFSLLQSKKPDVVFLDIMLGNGTSFDVLNKLENKSFNIVFVTGYEEYILQALRLSAVDYLLKPVQTDELLAALSRLKAKIEDKTEPVGMLDVLNYNMTKLNKTKKISIPYNKGYVVRNLDELVFIQASGNYTELHFSDKKSFILTKTLSEFEAMLINYNFFRIHQSYLINILFIDFFNGEELTLVLSTGETLPVSTRRRPFLLEKLKTIM
jgi:two-component system LytT family response regulator